jgi:hypothetical protein
MLNAEKLQRLLADLERSKMSVAEMAVMAVLLRAPLDAMKARHIVQWEFRGDDLEQAPHLYAEAIEGCRRKNWIGNITRLERDLRMKVRASENIPFVDDGVIGGVNQLDLTPEGYSIFRSAAKERYPRRGRYCPSSELQLELYSDTEAGCREYAASSFWERYPFDMANDETVYGILERISSPAQVGPWRFNRFEIVPQGYKISLRYHQT